MKRRWRIAIGLGAVAAAIVLVPVAYLEIGCRSPLPGIEAARTQLLGEKQPSLEFVTLGQIGALAVFLCSEAAAQIRGIALPVDGGWTAQ